MNILTNRFGNPSAIMALGLSLFTSSAYQISAATNPKVPPCPPVTSTCKDCNGNDTTDTSKCVSSFNLSIDLGKSLIERGDNYLTLSRAGLSEGQGGRGSYRDFDEIKNQVLDSNNLLNTTNQYLSVSVPAIEESLLSPSSLTYTPVSDVEYIEDLGAIKQVKSRTRFTEIEVLPNGYVVRSWPISLLTNTTKVGNLYEAPPVEDATEQVTLTNPDYPVFDNRLIMTITKNLSGSTTPYTISHLYDESQADKLIVDTYEGAIEFVNGNLELVGGGAATQTERETLIYSNRGTKQWDYTFERTFEQAENINGELGELGLVLKTTEVYEDFSLSAAGGESNGKRLISVVNAAGTGESQTTTHSYYEEPNNPYLHGRLKSSIESDGSWEYYEYNDSEASPVAVETKYSSWKDVSIADYTQGRKTVTTTQATESLREVSIQGVVQTKEKSSLVVDESTGRIHSIEEKWNGTEWVKQETVFEAQEANTAAQGRPIYTLYADGTAKTISYIESDGQTTVTESKGAIGNDISGGDEPVINAGTTTTTVYNTEEHKVSEDVTDIASGLLLSSELAEEFDISGRPIKITYNNNPNDYIISQYGCCGLEYSRDRSGATTTYYRDALKRVYRTITQRSANGEAITTSTDTVITDSDELKTTVTRSSNAGTLLVSEVTRSLGGLTITKVAPDADGDGNREISTRVIVHNAGTGSTTTNTAPDTGTTITATFLDGKTKSVSGTAVSNGGSMTYDYGTHALNGGGVYAKVTQANGTQFTKSFRDQLGRSFRTENTDGAYSETTYYPQSAAAGSRGKVESVKDADEVALAGSGSHVSYGYNERGERTSTTTKLSNGLQMVTTTEHDDVDDAEIGVSHRYRTWVNGVLTNTSLRSGDGYKSKSITLAGTSSSERSVPVDGSWTVTNIAANDASSIQSYTDGFMKSSESYDSSSPAVLITSNLVTHDAFGRVLTQVDARTGTVTYDGYNENGSLTGMTDAGGRTTAYTYDNMGRTITVDAPNTTDKDGNTIGNMTHTSYNLTGTVAGTWGDQTYARFNVYDAQNRLVELRTYQDLAHGTEPTLATTGFASTTWNYNPTRGWLDNKRYDDNKGTDYTYTVSAQYETLAFDFTVATSIS